MMMLGVLIPTLVWGAIALFVRRHPETMAGYNTMPRKKRERIDLHRIGRLVSNGMYGGISCMLLAPLMPTKGLFMTMLVGVPVGLLLAVVIYVNLSAKKFEKRG
ncbi:MAG: DUF3784 domain-containing protein [Alistipes sp.]|nr:DUF3784 domain-containing protein [Alistipes sp.]